LTARHQISPATRVGGEIVPTVVVAVPAVVVPDSVVAALVVVVPSSDFVLVAVENKRLIPATCRVLLSC